MLNLKGNNHIVHSNRLSWLWGVVFFLFGLPLGLAQNVVFPDQPDEFQKELGELFRATPDRQATKIFLDELRMYMNSADVSEEVKQTNIRDCRLLAGRRARPFPDYFTYFQTYFTFQEKGFWNQDYQEWHKAFAVLLADRKKDQRHLTQFLSLAASLVKNQVLFESPSLRWAFRHNNFSCHFEKNQLVIRVKDTDLIGYAQNDSLVIYETSGEYAAGDRLWTGTHGTIRWEHSQFPADRVNATFNHYRMDLSKPFFSIDTVKFVNKNYFGYPLYGSLEHKIMAERNPNKVLYPKFQSFNQHFEIKNIFPGIHYEGGFAQDGSKFMGTGTPQKQATVSIYRNDTLQVVAQSLLFGIYPDLLVSSSAEISIRLDSLDIYHPGLNFRYMHPSNELHLIRTADGLGKSPYFNHYHKISMDVELIRWKLSNTYMELRMMAGAAQNQALFESLDYYREDFFNQLQGMDAIHPLQALRDYSLRNVSREFTARDYALYRGLPEFQIRQQLLQLSFYGFLEYNVNNDGVKLKDRLFNYMKYRFGKMDFDVIRFNSLTPGRVSNAELDLRNFDLKMNGVSAVAIASHQNVVFFPREGSILLKYNRDFRFDGVINAGMLRFFGDGFAFDYNQFRIDLSSIDSLRMRIRSGELDYFGQPVMRDVHSTINRLSGYLQIDRADNKSGNKNLPQYPILTSLKDSYVYYQKKEIQNGAYKKDQFFFKVDPFVMDSISNLTRRNTQFEGTFESNIFPAFNQKLVVRPDYSLGFVQDSPPLGYPVYNHKATFTQKVDLSNQGLRGNGVLHYVTSTAASENFLFLPEEVSGQTHAFKVEKQTVGVPFPDVNATYTQLSFLPNLDQLSAKSQEDNFTMFNSEAQLEGTLRVAPSGLSGRGNLFMLRASLNSRYMNFDDHSVLADTSEFKLVNKGTQDISFSTKNLVSTIDFEKRMGTFTSIFGGTRVDFTDNKYMSFISAFSWNMDNNDIFLGASGSKGNKFISVHRKQDSLYFYAPMARFDAENMLIEAEEVKEIRSADAQILLKNGRITIRPDAVMDPLDSVQIVLADRDSLANHRLYNARVTIDGAKNYSGFGNYDFTNAEGVVYKLFMDKIQVDNQLRTNASGFIGEESRFLFDPHFAYKGIAGLQRGRRLLEFDGGVQMYDKDQPCPRTWIRFLAPVDPLKVTIPVGKRVENYDRDEIHRNLFIRKDSIHVYSSFFESRKDYSDIPIVTGEGELYYNEREKSFDVSSAGKRAQPDSTGTLLRFVPNGKTVTGEGVLNLGVELDPVYTMASGTISHHRDANAIVLHSSFEMNFFLDNRLVFMIYQTLVDSKTDASDFSRQVFERRLKEYMPVEKLKTLWKDAGLAVSDNKLPDAGNLFTFSDMEWSWSHSRRGYVANGEAHLALLKGRNLNRKIQVKAELIRSRLGNSIDFLIEAGPEWFYFSYKGGTMQILSSVKAFNELLQQIKPDDRKLKGGSKAYVYLLAPDSKRKRFLMNFGKENPEEIQQEAAPDGETGE